MDNTILLIVMRYLHVVSAVAAVGGTAFLIVCVLPSLRVVEDNLRTSVLSVMQQRFQTVLWMSILGLTVSGAINWMVLASTYRAVGPIANALIGTKVLLAFVLFGIIIAQSGGLIGRTKAWLMVNIHLAAVIILLGSILRQLRLEHVATVAG